MIAEFSSFIELSAAVYVTMCLDSEKFKLFWNPDRKVTVSDMNLQTKIDGSVEITRDNEILSLRRMGLFMIAICFMLLALVGFEKGMSVETERFSVPLIFAYCLVFLIELIHNAIFKRMKVVILLLIGIVVLFLTLWFWTGLNDSLQCGFLVTLYEKMDLLTTFLLLFPMVAHVLRLWLRSSVQRGYLRSKVEKETSEYEKAVQAINVGKPAGVSEKYLNAWNQVENPKDPDPDITPFTSLYVESVVKELYPNDIQLICSFVIHWIKKIWHWLTWWMKKE